MSREMVQSVKKRLHTAATGGIYLHLLSVYSDGYIDGIILLEDESEERLIIWRSFISKV